MFWIEMYWVWCCLVLFVIWLFLYVDGCLCNGFIVMVKVESCWILVCLFLCWFDLNFGLYLLCWCSWLNFVVLLLMWCLWVLIILWCLLLGVLMVYLWWLCCICFVMWWLMVWVVLFWIGVVMVWYVFW